MSVLNTEPMTKSKLKKFQNWHISVLFLEISLGQGNTGVRVCEFIYVGWKGSSLTFLLFNWVRSVFKAGKVWGDGISLPFSAWFALDQSHCLNGSGCPPANASRVTSISLQSRDMVLVTWWVSQTCSRPQPHLLGSFPLYPMRGLASGEGWWQ